MTGRAVLLRAIGVQDVDDWVCERETISSRAQKQKQTTRRTEYLWKAPSPDIDESDAVVAFGCEVP